MQESLLSEVTKVTKLSEEGLYTKTKTAPLYENMTLTKISKMDKTLIAKSLGDFGKRLKHFTEFFDIQHPHVGSLMMPLGNGKLLELSNILDITETAVNNDLTGLLGLMSSTFNNPTFRNLTTNLSNAPIRLLKERVDREYARVAGASNIDLESGERVPKAPSDMILFKPVNVLMPTDWSNASATFENYVRLSSQEGDVVARLTYWFGKLYNMGMTHQADSYRAKLSDIRYKASTNYCGFHKLGINEACATLGKVHDFRAQIPFSKVIMEPNDPKIVSLFKLMMPSATLAKLIHHFFGTNKPWERTMTIADNILNLRGGTEEDMENDIASFYSFMTTKHRVNLFEYQARLYPIHAFQIFMPDRIKAMIDDLEAYEPLSGKPVFDRFHVMVPGVTFDQSYFQHDLSGKYRFKSKDKMIELSNKDEAFFLMDSFLMKRGAIYPVVLGMKDNEHYFLNYWDV